MEKPTGTDTYSYRPAEVAAMVAHCRAHPSLNWLGEIVVALACTGLRISELASLRWSDIDWQANMIVLTDETTRARRTAAGKVRALKNRRSRTLVIHDELRDVLLGMDKAEDGRIFRTCLP